MAEETEGNQNIQADENSTAIGKIEVGGSIGGDLIVGGTHNYYYASPEAAKSSLTNEKISTEPFEPETILIAEGAFWMGSNPDEGVAAHETPRHEVLLATYRIGKYPVTNEQYEKFVLETARSVAPEMLWDGLKPAPGTELQPVVAVNWYEAVAYCEWLSKTTGRKYALPNEAQWEKACRGLNQTFYPWGDEFQEGRCNQGNAQIAAVDAFPAQNDYGCFDLVGNVRQWTASLWGESPRFPDARFAYPWKNDRRNDLSANGQIRRVVRGSSFKDDAKNLRCSLRSGQFPKGLVDATRGFRVAMLV
jgi:formylglycine-generating enzyme required for sulfatase activity